MTTYIPYTFDILRVDSVRRWQVLHTVAVPRTDLSLKYKIKQKQCKTKGNANAKSNIHFITGMKIDTCRYRNPIEEDENRKKYVATSTWSSIDLCHSLRQITSSGIYACHAFYASRNAIIFLISSVSFYLFTLPVIFPPCSWAHASCSVNVIPPVLYFSVLFH